MKRITGHPYQPKAKAPGIFAKALAFIETVTGPLTDDATFAKRHQLCSVCPKVRRSEGNLYCGGCGCSRWKLAELTTKLRFQNLRCPLGNWGD